MTGSEALGMLLGKEIYDSVKNKIDANDCYDVIRYIVLNELGILDNKGNLSESIKEEIREEFKKVIVESFIEDDSNIKETFEECEKECSCDKECENKSKENSDEDEQVDFASALVELFTDRKCSEADKKAIREACSIMNKAFGNKM